MQYRRDNKTWLIWSCNFHLLSLWLYSFLLIIWKIFISKKILKILDLKKVLRFGGISSTLKTLVCTLCTIFILLKLETFLLVLRFVYNSAILTTALRRLPEFAGYQCQTYPGQPSPRRYQIEPRRYKTEPRFKTHQFPEGRKFLNIPIKIIVSSSSSQSFESILY